MIGKSSQIAGTKKLANHLVSNENESVRIVTSYGLVSGDSIHSALAEMEAIAKSSCCEKHLYHVSISPSPDESITDKQWIRAWELYDQVHNLHGLPFIEVEHNKKNRTHRHRVYERVNPETGLAINLPWTRIKNERVCRQLEVEFRHKVITGKHNRAVINAIRNDGLDNIADKLSGISTSKPKISSYTHNEWQQDKKDNSLTEIRKLLAQAWLDSLENCRLIESLKNYGFSVKNGTKAILAVDKNGKEYPMLRNINVGLKTTKQPTIKKEDLDRKLRQVPIVKTEPISIIESCKQKKQKEDKLSDCNKKTPRYKNNIYPTQHVRHNWVIYRENLLNKLYKNLEVSNLAKYWKIQQQDNGLVHLTNKLGTIIDHGDKISSNASNHDLAAQTMVKLAIAKDWHKIRVNGDEEFKVAVYREAIKNNIECTFECDDDYHLWLQVNRSFNSNRTSLRPR